MAEQAPNAVDEVSPTEAWAELQKNPRSVLIDVRSRAEWALVGLPDLSVIGKRPILAEWSSFPENRVAPDFVDGLRAELDKAGVYKDWDLYFLCRSGGRSLKAAVAMAGAGYRRCHNVSEGFEGRLGPTRKRDVAGWKKDGLPWIQG